MRKKLIEVALPLEAINEASAREKSIRHGHPSTLHLWWARRPLAAARAVIFASLVDDPHDPQAPPAFVAACKALPKGRNATDEDTPRQRLFDFIETLVKWESTTDERVLATARELIRLATGGNPPPLLDPFAGGGSIPLEAQRLGLEAHASDLNPVAVMINKAQIEIPPRFANRPPVNPRDRGSARSAGVPPARLQVEGGWKGAAGLAADVRYYGAWMRDRAYERIGHLYPQMNGETVIAWLWARTVTCPNPACRARMPLVRSFDLSTKKGKRAWVEPHVNPKTRAITFHVRQAETGKGPSGTVNRRGTKCIACGTPVPFDHVRSEGRAGRMSQQLMAIVTEGSAGRNYHTPDERQVSVAEQAVPEWQPDFKLPHNPRDFKTPNYGMKTFADLFTPRQLVALTTFSDLVAEAREEVCRDGLAAGLPDDDTPLREGGAGARAYAEAVSVYLAFAVDKGANYWSTLCAWHTSAEKMMSTYSRQALPMVWDYTEANPFSDSSGNFSLGVDQSAKSLEKAPFGVRAGTARQGDAISLGFSDRVVISTDPPYYDNIGYADLSDFFYVWMRRVMQPVFPELFPTMLVPKKEELIASPYRFEGSKDAANEHFEKGLAKAFARMRTTTAHSFPLTIFYAFKQSEIVVADESRAIERTGWETMLNSLIGAGFVIGGTWPMRTEMTTALKKGVNALASSIVLVCRPRPEDAPATGRRQFVAALRRELPPALRQMQSGHIAPVDLAQASIGPGMAVYSRYRQVLEPNGERLTVRTALQLINQVLDEFLAETEGDVDADTRFAVDWFKQYGFQPGPFGSADVLARAKNTSVEGLVNAGVLSSRAGRVQLLPWDALDAGWDPTTDKRATVWEATHHLIERLNTHGEDGAALLLAKMPAGLAAAARQLAYRLYSICERKGWAEHARDYNALVVSWSESQERAAQVKGQPQQGRLFGKA